MSEYENHLSQSQAHLDAGRTEQALALAHEVLTKAPQDADALSLAATTSIKRARYFDAANYLRRELAVRPQAPSFNNLGLVLRELAQLPEAEAAFRSALQLQPDYTFAAGNLAVVLKEQGKTGLAEQVLRAALATQPRDAELHFSLARLLREQERVDEAVTEYQCAVRDQPDHVNALCNLAILFEQQNRPDEALATARAGLVQAPNDGLLRAITARCLRRCGDLQGARQQLEELPMTANDVAAVQEIGFELGHIYDQLGDAAQAFEHFRIGNNALLRRAAGRGINKQRYPQMAVELLEFAHRRAASLGGRRHQATPHGAPIFLVGFPRSGTTLLDAVLDAHPQVCVLPEKPTTTALKQAVHALPGGYPKALEVATASQLRQLRSAYYAEVERHVTLPAETVLVDKMPLALVDVPALLTVFPEARFVVALRHPYDVCLSCYIQAFELNDSMIHFCRLEDTAQLYAQVMGNWRTYQQLLRFPVHSVRYEDLIDDFDRQIGTLLQFLGVAWSEQVREFAQRATQRGLINTPSYHQVSRPLYHDARYRWKKYRSQIEVILAPLQPYVRAFGYEAEQQSADGVGR